MNNSSLPDKPKFMAPCNGCGLCCANELCPAAEIAFPDARPPCPALVQAPGEEMKTACHMVLIEKQHHMDPMLQKALGIGVGCTMQD